MKVVLVGGGIIGCSAALALADRGADVVLVERGELGAEASSVAAGILGAQVESHDPGDTEGLRLRVRARDDYAQFCAMLTERTGLPTGHRVSGVVSVATSAEAREKLAHVVAHQTQLGLVAELWDGSVLAQREPLAAPAAHGAAYFPHDAQVEPRKVLRALIACLEQRKVVVRRAEVTGFATASARCAGVGTSAGAIDADAVIVCTGAFTSLLAERTGAELPAVEPVRGHIVTVQGSPRAEADSHAIIFGEGGSYVVPRSDGRLVCGTTVERVGFSRGPTAAGVAEVLARAHALVPSTASALFVEARASFRPFSAEGPVVRQTATRGLFVATGHHRNGILLAKWTADEIARHVLG